MQTRTRDLKITYNIVYCFIYFQALKAFLTWKNLSFDWFIQLLYGNYLPLGDHLYNGSPYAIGPLPVCLSLTLVYCGQTVGWIKMKLGVEVGLGPGHIELDGEAALPERGPAPPVFGPCLLWPSGCLSQLLRPAHVVQWSNHLGAMCSRTWRSQWPRIDSSLGPGASAY